MSMLSINLRVWTVRGLCATVVLSILAAGASAEHVVRVEEDWELVIDQPNPDSVAPQVLCTISPVGNVDGLYATLEVNHATVPDYSAGGLQFAIWNGQYAIQHKKFPNESVLATASETITWTQTMEVSDGSVAFEVINGDSTTWGKFGGQGYLKGSARATSHCLNGYSPAVSVAKSKVGFAGNRVASLTLKKVRVYTDDGQMIEADTPQVVHSNAGN